MGQEALRLGDGEDCIGKIEIANRVAELGEYYTDFYKNADEVVAVILMQGALFFGADLIRAIDHPNIIVDTTRVKSQAGIQSSGKVMIRYDTDHHIKNKHTLLIEDILDKGPTLSLLTKRMYDSSPASLAVASMFEKPVRRLPDTELALDDLQIGMRIHDEFVVGYGLDWNGKYRHLQFVTKTIEVAPGIFAPMVSKEPVAAMKYQ